MKVSLYNPDILTSDGHQEQRKCLPEFAKTLPRIPDFPSHEDKKWTKKYNDVVTAYLHEKMDIRVIESALDINLNTSKSSRPYIWKWEIHVVYYRNTIEIYIYLPADIETREQRKEVFFRGMNESLQNWVSYYQKLIPLRVYMENFESLSDFEDSDDYERWIEVVS